jgi:hypothetical protein
MFEVKTTLRTYKVEADHINGALIVANLLAVEGEEILSVAYAGPVTFIIVEVAA